MWEIFLGGIQGAFKMYPTLFVLAKTNVMWGKSFQWKLTSPFLRVCENFLANKPRLFSADTPRVQTCSARWLDFRFHVKWPKSSSRDIASSFPFTTRHLFDRIPTLRIGTIDFWFFSNLKTTRFPCGEASALWGRISSTLAASTNPLKLNAQIMCLFPLRRNSLSTEVQPCLMRSYHSLIGFSPWHHRDRSAESSGWFEFEYHQYFCKTWFNISALCVRSSCVKRRIRRAHSTRLYSRHNIRELTSPIDTNFFTHAQEEWCHLSPKALNLLGKIKVRYFLKALRMWEVFLLTLYLSYALEYIFS